MKKIFIILAISLILFPVIVLAADPIVNCGTSSQVGDRCTFDKFTNMPIIVITWIKTNLIIPLAILLITIGGLIMLFSAGSPEYFKLGKTIIFASLIGGLLAYGAASIVNMVLVALGGAPLE